MTKAIHILSRGVLIDDGYILLSKSIEHDFYFLPGGHVEDCESVEAALIREIKEESGFDCSIKRFLGCMEHIFEPTHSMCHNHEYNFVFEIGISRLNRHTIIPRLEEHIELKWVLLDNLKSINFLPPMMIDSINLWLGQNFNNAFKSGAI